MDYNYIANEKLNALFSKKNVVILAIESSCDETAASVIKGDKILSNIVASQIDIHKRFGGVVPEIASRNHVASISTVVNQAVKEANLTLEKDIDVIAVTYGAGLQGALLVGVAFAKALAYALKLPLIAVNHIRGHIAVNYLVNKVKFPYLSLIISGGNTAIALVKDYTDFEILGTTIDDACGECFDKVARVLGLPYPGGPQIEKLASGADGDIIFPSPAFEKGNMNFSFSGIKTAVINYVHKLEQQSKEVDKANVAASFQNTVISGIVENLSKAFKIKEVADIVLAGGVASNSKLRKAIEDTFGTQNVKVHYPPIKYCTDNAVMIATEAMALIKSKKAKAEDLTLDVKTTLGLSEIR